MNPWNLFTPSHDNMPTNFMSSHWYVDGNFGCPKCFANLSVYTNGRNDHAYCRGCGLTFVRKHESEPPEEMA